jgi:serine/threonine-protein kinase
MRAAIVFCFFASHIVFAQTAQPVREHVHFPPGAIWTQDISAVAADSNSGTMTTASVGWGTGGAGGTKFQIDFSMHLLYASWDGYSTEPLVKNDGYYGTDCESGVAFPLPPETMAGAVESVSDYSSCDYQDGDDCHLSVVLGNTLYESYQTGVDSSGLHSTCVIRWHLNVVYPSDGRGEGCTSTDAAGFPIGTMLFSPDDVFAATQVTNGDLGHALRFTMPNDRMRAASYVHPASHNGAPNSTNANAIPYGARLRLKMTFDGTKNVTNFTTNESARVILRTLQKYGMFLSDGGGIPLIADDGMFSTKSWDDLSVDSHALFGIALGDFDVMPLGTVIHYDNNDQNAECVRNHFGEDVIFSDGNNW